MASSSSLAGFLVAWVRFAMRRAGAVLAGLGVVTLLLGAYAATHLGVNMDNKSTLLATDLPFQQRARAFEERFPVLNDSLIVVIDGPSADAARQASRALGARLRARPDVAHDVFEADADPFFETHSLLYLDTDELGRFADQLDGFQPFLTELAHEPDLPTLASLLSRSLAADRLNAPPEEIAPVLDRFGEAAEAVYAERPLSVSWADLMLRNTALEEARPSTVIVDPVLDFDALLPAGRPIEAIRQLAEEEGLVPDAGYRVRVTGYPALNHEEMIGLVYDVFGAGLVSFAVVLGVLAWVFRSGRMVTAAATTLVTGLIWTAAFAALAVGRLNVISIAFAVLFIGLGVDFAIHLGMHYAALRKAGEEHETAMEEAVRGIGTALVLCAFTTSVGFWAFVPTDYKGVAELGLISGTGMFVILVLTLSLFPALLTRVLRPAELRHGSDAGPDVSRLLARPGLVLAATAVVSAAVVVPALNVHFDSNVVRMRNPDTESVQAWNDLLAAGSASPWYADVVEPGPEQAAVWASRLEKLPDVSETRTLADYVPKDQDEKLAILSDLAFVFDVPGGPAPAEDVPVEKQIAALQELRDALARADLSRAGRELGRSGRLLQQRLDDFLSRAARDPAPGPALDALEAGLLGDFPRQFDRLLAAFDASRVTEASLPPRLRSWMVSSDGSWRVQIFPSADLSEERALRHFVDAVLAVAPEATGLPVNLVEFGRATAASLRQALVLALASIAALLLLLWRRPGDAVVALTPLALGGLWTVAAMTGLGIHFNFANVVVLPLLLGIGVDSGIHLVSRARVGHTDPAHLAETTTGRAVFFSAFTTLASFGSLASAGHRGIASMGQLLILGMALSLVANLVVLPAWLAWRASSSPAELDDVTEPLRDGG